VTEVPQRAAGLGRSLAAGALVWSVGLLGHSVVEDAVNAARGLHVPAQTLGAIALIHVAVGLAIGVVAGAGAWVLSRLLRGAGGPLPTLVVSVPVALVLAFVGLKLNDRVLPEMLTATGLAVNGTLVLGALAAWFGLARHVARRWLPGAFAALLLPAAVFVAGGMHLDTFFTAALTTGGAALAYAALATACLLLHALLAVLLGAWRPRAAGPRHAVAGLGAAAAVALALAALQPERPSVQAAAPGRPHVVWLVLDTLRADHLSTYGYGLRTSPNIDAIGAEGAVFEQTIAGSSWTMPSHFHMVTGNFEAGRERLLSETHVTAAEILRERGYRTAAVLANPSLGRGSGFEQGFETFVDAPPLFLYLDLLGKASLAEALTNRRLVSARFAQRLLYRKTFQASARAEGDFVNAHVFRWLERHDGGPFFLFVNYLDPHEPYDPQEPFRSRFAADVDPEIGFIRYDRPLGRFISTEEMTRDVVPRTPAERWRQMVQLYDAEIAFLDEQVGALARELQRRNLWDDTIFIVTSDHGELFGEHGLATHFKALTEEELRVPLIVRYPRGIPPGTRIATPVELVDVLPTVLDFVGGGIPPMDGRSLRPLVAGDASARTGETYSFLLRKPRRGYPHTAAGDLVALRSPQSKYVWSSTGQHAFYDLQTDARELQNLFGDGRPPAATRTRLEEWRLAKGLDRAEGKLDRLTEDRLKALGYID
jgi:arylsulfatase A-like enzyme